MLIDGHNDLAWQLRERCGADLGACDIAGSLPGLHTDLPRLRAGGVNAQFWSVWVPSTLGEAQAVVATLEQIDLVRRLVTRHEGLEFVVAADGIEAAHRAGRIASLIGVEGGHCIAGSLAVLRQLHRLGARYLTLTHNDNTAWADAATDRPGVAGLSPFGHEVVGELNRLGMMVDLSHTADSTMRAALASSAAPVIFSHSNARALCDVPRNVPDDVLALVPGNGGIVMVTFVARYVTCERPATLSDVVGHFDYLRDTIGIEHVGIGGDFDGDDGVTSGLEDVSCYPHLIDALRSRGWSTSDIDAVTSRNMLRVMRDVESVSRVY